MISAAVKRCFPSAHSLNDERLRDVRVVIFRVNGFDPATQEEHASCLLCCTTGAGWVGSL